MSYSSQSYNELKSSRDSWGGFNSAMRDKIFCFVWYWLQRCINLALGLNTQQARTKRKWHSRFWNDPYVFRASFFSRWEIPHPLCQGQKAFHLSNSQYSFPNITCYRQTQCLLFIVDVSSFCVFTPLLHYENPLPPTQKENIIWTSITGLEHRPQRSISGTIRPRRPYRRRICVAYVVLRNRFGRNTTQTWNPCQLDAKVKNSASLRYWI